MSETFLPGTLRDRLKDLMSRDQISQKTLAGTMDIDQSTLGRFLSGQTEKMGSESVIRAARLFGVSTDFLLGLTNIPDRKSFGIDELGLSPQAARNLYCKRLDTRVVSLLLESPEFAAVTYRIANFISGSLAAGFAAQNQLADCVAELLYASGYPQADQQIRALKVPAFQQELTGIQSGFITAVKSLKKDMELEVKAQVTTKEQFRNLISSCSRTDSGAVSGISPQTFAETLTEPVSPFLSPNTQKLLNQALTATAKELQNGSDKKRKKQKKQ